MEMVNLTNKQQDYAVFLPAISNAFTATIGKMRREPDYYKASRIPASFEYGVEGLNWMNHQDCYFTYKWNLYSAGHANLDMNKDDASEIMIRDRNREHTWILGDSGGFQIAKGLWVGDWRNPNSAEVKQSLADAVAQGTAIRTDKKGKPVKIDLVKEHHTKLAAAQQKREAVLKWLDAISDYGMILDIPTWVIHDPKASIACNISTYQEAVDATKFNNEYFMQHRKGYKNGGTRLLNVLQGSNHKEADAWYDLMKEYCDPKIYPDTHFNGWAMGGQNMCDVDLILRRIVNMIHDGLLNEGYQDHMHFLGTSKLEWAGLLTDIQRAVRKYHNPKFTITFDCASPFLAAANGQIYHEILAEHNGKWTYRMNGGVDDKKYSSDTRSFKDVVLADKLLKTFEDSPVTARCQIKDICTYAPGDLNKIGKEGKTSWDTLSYSILMTHNAFLHIESVQRANRQYDQGIVPRMLLNRNVPFRDMVDEIFSASSLERSLELIKNSSRYWMQIVGTRGFTGERALNGMTTYNDNFA